MFMGTDDDLPIGKVNAHQPRLNGNGPRANDATANHSHTRPNPHITMATKIPTA